MFDEKISRRSFLTGGAKVAAALFVAPAIIKAEHLMKVYVPPEKVIELDPNSYNFTISGIVPGSNVYVADPITGEVYINEVVNTSRKGWNLPESGGLGVVARVRKAGYQAIQSNTGLPYPNCKNKIALAMQRDIIHS